MRLRNFLFLLTLASITLVSCSTLATAVDVYSAENAESGNGGSLTAVINSVTLVESGKDKPDTIVSDTRDLNFFTRKAVLIKDVITITGTTAFGDVVNVTVRGAKEGKFVLDFGMLENDSQAKSFLTIITSYMNIEGETKKASFLSTKGTVTITKIDKEQKIISGNFEFNLVSGDVYKAIKKGKFENLKYSTK